jgi:hypothetical protein
MAQEQKYTLHGLTAEQLTAAIDKLWPELKSDPELSQLVRDAGVDPAKLPDSRSDAITIENKGAGFDPATIAILVAFGTALAPKAAELTAEVAKDVWEKVILPVIRRDKGPNSVKPAPR